MTETIRLKSLATKAKKLPAAKREVFAIRNYLGLCGEQLAENSLKSKVAESPDLSWIVYFSMNWKKFGDISDFFDLSSEQETSVKLRAELLLALRETLRNRQLTHEAAAEIAGVTRSAFTSIFGGHVESVSLDRMLDICLKLGVSIRYEISASR